MVAGQPATSKQAGTGLQPETPHRAVMGWAGRQIKPARRHVPMPRRWAWLHVAPSDITDAIIDGKPARIPARVRLAHTVLIDGRARHGRALLRHVREVWAVIDDWVPRRGRLWIWGHQPDLMPWALGLHLGLPELAGWKREHTRFGSDSCVVHWTRGQSRVVLAFVGGALPWWDDADRGPIRAMRDEMIAWAAQIEHKGLGRLQPSMGAQAWESYRAGYCDGELWAGGSDRHTAIARAAYVGGIAHRWRSGYDARQWYSVDMSRCYRSVMRDEHLPLRSTSYLTFPRLSILQRAVTRDCVVAHVLLSSRGLLAPDRDDLGQLHWDTGKGWATLTTPDLVDALEAGLVDECRAMATWTRGRPLRRWALGVEGLEASARALGGAAAGGRWKWLANALYGRLGMRSRRWRKLDTVDDPGIRTWEHWNASDKRIERFRQIGRIVEHEGQPSEHQWGHPAAAAHIAAHGRARLRRVIDCAGLEHVAYVDTDGCIVTEDGLIALQESALWDTLALRVEASGSIDIRGVRDYDIGVKRVQAGTPRAAREGS